MAVRLGTQGADNAETGVPPFEGTESADQMYGMNGNDIVKGYGGNDQLYGGNDDDIILGGEGDDENYGGAGDDQIGDLSSSDDDDLDPGNDFMSGGSGDDDLSGGAGFDILVGGTGLDRLNGGLDKDKLWGGEDSDIFAFAHMGKANADKIMDWEKIDQIAFDQDVFSKLKFDGAGDLKKKFFHVGKEAEDKKDKLIYNQDKGKLYYDPTGSKNGKSDMELIAKLDKGTKLKYTDFEMLDV